MKIVFYDIESSGLKMEDNHIVEISLINEKGDQLYYKLNPGVPIQPNAMEVHGITDEDVQDCPYFTDVADDIYRFVNGSVHGGYNNISFDVPLLLKELNSCGYDMDINRIQKIDVYKIWMAMEKRTLKDGYLHFCNKQLMDAHTADADVKATIEIFHRMREMYEDIDFIDLCEKRNDTSRKLSKKGSDIYFTFGKHKGKNVEWIYENDKQYLKWVIQDGGFSQHFINELRKEVERVIEKNS